MNAFTPLKKYCTKVIIAPLFKAVECTFELLTPFVVRYIIDEGIANSDWKLVIWLSLALFGFAIVGFGCTMITQYLASRVSSDYGYDLKRAMYDKEQTLGEAQLEKFGKDKILNLFSSDSYNIQTGVAMGMRLLIRSPFIIIGSMVLSFVIHWVAGIVFSVALVLIVIVQLTVVYLSPRKYASIQGGLDEMASRASDTFSGFRPIRAYDREKEEVSAFDTKSENYRKRNVSLGALNAFLNPLSIFFLYLGLVLIIYFGNLYVHEGVLTTGEIVSLMGYITATLASLTMFSRLVNSLNKAFASKKRVDSFFALEGDSYPKQSEGIIEGAPLIEFKDVGFAYDGDLDHLCLDGISLKIMPGEKVGFIGGTGSGKSTMAFLIERLLHPTKGEIFFEGRNINSLPEEELHRKSGIVLQKPALYKGTIRDNLSLGRKDVDDDELVEAMKKSLAYEFVSKYQDGLNHPISEGGANLSGGQKQRLQLSRAFIGHKDVLVLDDCLSALDYLSEKKVRENLSKMEGTALIMVSQRTSSLIGCDRIYVFDDGHIVAEGKHDELLKSCLLYKEIYDTQRAAR